VKEQTDGITQINVAVGQMDKVTQNTAATAEETAAAAEELNSQASCMKSSVSELLQLVGGGAGSFKGVNQAETPEKSNAREGGIGRIILPKQVPSIKAVPSDHAWRS
jgi:hypothetical protein